jgi:hypothetical protein
MAPPRVDADLGRNERPMRQHVYRPLWRYLLALPAAQPRLQLTLPELEALLGPRRTPSGFPAWIPQDLARTFDRRTSFRVRFDRQRECVTFTRRQPAPQERA